MRPPNKIISTTSNLIRIWRDFSTIFTIDFQMVPDRAFFQIFKITEKILLIQNIMDSFKSRPKNSKFNPSLMNQFVIVS